jgi:HEAT repeat protein
LNIPGKVAAAAILALFLSAGIPAAASDSDFILRELQRDDWEGRLLNKASVERMNDPQSTESLIEIVSNRGVNWRLQIRGIRLLGEIRTPRVKEALLQLSSDIFFHQGCPAVKTSLALSLGNFSDPRVVAFLIEGLADQELVVREACIVALGRIGDASAVPYLIPQLKDKSFMIRLSAIRSLGLLKDARAASSLKKIADNDRELLLKTEALAALSMIRT